MDTNDPVNSVIIKYSSHPSIVKIKTNQVNASKFKFEPVTCDDIWNYIMKLDKKKKTSGNIPIFVLLKSAEISCPYITHFMNKCITDSFFPDELKCAHVRPCHKESSDTDKTNYRPISLLLLSLKYLKESFMTK